LLDRTIHIRISVEAKYRELTFDLTLAAARALAAANPSAAFCYVFGEGTDSTAQGKTMWARVKGVTESATLALPLNSFMFRPGFVRPRAGVKSKTALYRSELQGPKELVWSDGNHYDYYDSPAQINNAAIECYPLFQQAFVLKL
jgi:hypothetical protein